MWFKHLIITPIPSSQLHHSHLGYQQSSSMREMLQDAAMQRSASISRRCWKSARAVRVAPELRQGYKVRHERCGKLDAMPKSRNCIDCFELPTCQCMDLRSMQPCSDNNPHHRSLACGHHCIPRRFEEKEDYRP